MVKIKDFLNKKFDKLLIIEQDKIKRNGRTYLKCLCDCGNTVVIEINNFCKRKNKDCGCIEQQRLQNIRLKIGDKINNLTITMVHINIKRCALTYGYLCDCGRKGFFNGYHKLIKSCGCGGKAYKGISGDYWDNIKRAAKNRNLEFNVTKEEVWNLLVKQKFKCKLTGIKLKIRRTYRQRIKNYSYRKRINDTTASLDRIDSSKGYITGNVQWVHKWINIIKWDFSEKEFFSYIKQIYEYNNLQNVSV